jgi:N-acetylglucosamine kinase-like BadF-type ATPase
MSEKEYLLGVDGDGKRTQALLADREGNVLARGLGPDSNIHTVGLEAFGKAVRTAVDGALLSVVGPRVLSDQPGWQRVKIAAACFGLAGIDNAEDEAQVSKWLRDNGMACTLRVLNDSELVLAAGTPDGWGVALICATGSVCLARTADGRVARVGGWGHLMGDEGSAYRIAIRALSFACQTADGRRDAKGLLAAVLDRWSLRDASALIRHVYAPSVTTSDIAVLADVVLGLASRGDAAALSIVEESARELTKHVVAAAGTLGMTKPPLALSGGTLRGSLRHLLQEQVAEHVGATQYVADPALGAVRLARRASQSV